MLLNTVSTSELMIHLELIGRLDAVAVEEIQDEFFNATNTLDKHLILDIRKMPYVSSLGIAMLLSTEQAQKKRGLKVVLLGPQPEVRVLLKQLKIGELMPVFDSLSDAIEYLESL